MCQEKLKGQWSPWTLPRTYVDTLYLYYDYMGIKSSLLVNGKQIKLGQEIQEFYDSIKDRLNVVFKKVKSHSGDTYNEK